MTCCAAIRIIGLPVAFICAASVAASPAFAQELVNLKIISAQSSSSMPARMIGSTLLPAIDKRLQVTGSKFRIEWSQTYGDGTKTPGNSAAKDPYAEVQQGKADLAHVQIGVRAGYLPSQQITYYVPFTGLKPKILLPVMRKMIDQVPELRQIFMKRNQLLLAIGVSTDFVLVSKFLVDNVDSLKGKKIGVTGAAANWLKQTGADIVSGSPGTFRQGLGTGRYDGVLISASDMADFKLFDGAPYVTRIGMGSMMSDAFTVSKDRWDSLPGNAQNAIMGGFREFEEQIAMQSEAASEAAMLEAQKRGAKIVVLNEAERKRWADTLPNLAKQWAEETRKTGVPARIVLQTYLNELRAGGPALVRDWSK